MPAFSPGGLTELGGNKGVILRQTLLTAIKVEKNPGEIISVASISADAAELPSEEQGKLRISGGQFFRETSGGEKGTQ